jgi:hypothetical protein
MSPEDQAMIDEWLEHNEVTVIEPTFPNIDEREVRVNPNASPEYRPDTMPSVMMARNYNLRTFSGGRSKKRSFK